MTWGCFCLLRYIAVYPVFLSRQNTRVAPSEAMYHESDLCVFRKNWETEVEDNKLSVQYRKLLAQDSAYVFIYVFLICTIETHNIVSDSLNYSIFNIIFEVIRYSDCQTLPVLWSYCTSVSCLAAIVWHLHCSRSFTNQSKNSLKISYAQLSQEFKSTGVSNNGTEQNVT